jgi:sodium pump decarboxylase gamma subunit
MLLQGFFLMFIGMGIVIAFLTLLVFLMSGLRHLVKHIDHLLPDDADAALAPPVKKNPLSKDQATAIAIAIAVANQRTR